MTVIGDPNQGKEKMKCHKARASLILLITLITMLISSSTIHSWSLHRVRPVIIRQAPQAYHHAPPFFPLRSPAESIRDQGTEMEGSDSHQRALYHDMMDQSASEFDTYRIPMMESQSVKGQGIKDGQSIRNGQQRIMIPMMMPQSMKSGRFQSARADPMMTSASEMQMPMMMPMPLTTAMHNQFMKGQQMMQQLMDQMMKMNPFSSMSSMSQSQPMSMSSPCGMSASQPMMMGGGGGGGKGGFDLLGMLQQLSPMNFMQNLQSMFNSMRMSGMGIFGMMSPGSQMSGMQMNSPCMMGE